MSIPSPYTRTTFRDRPLDWATAQFLATEVEPVLGYELTITQGIGGASASAGTHTEGRAVDLAAWDHERKVKVLRDKGCAAWYRPELPGVWGPHIHAILIFNGRDNSRGLAPVGFDQIRKYDAGQDGLAGSNPDPNKYRPTPKRGFSMEEYRASFAPTAPRAPAPTNVSRARDAIVEAMHSTTQAIALLKDAEGRTKAQGQIDELQAARQRLNAVLLNLPQR